MCKHVQNVVKCVGCGGATPIVESSSQDAVCIVECGLLVDKVEEFALSIEGVCGGHKWSNGVDGVVAVPCCLKSCGN